MQTKKRKARRKTRSSAGSFWKKLLMMLVIVIIVVFGVTIFFKVEIITVIGGGHYSDQQVIEASGIQLGDNMTLVDKSGAASQLRQQLPYVQDIRIRRKLPGTVELELTLCEPAAVVVSEYGDNWLISAEGKLLEQITPAQAADYMVITGFHVLLPTAGETLQADQQEQLDAAMAVINALQTVTLDPAATSLDVEKLYDVQMFCGTRFQVRLGSAEELEYKLRYLQAAVAQLKPEQEGIIDLTFQEEKVARFLPW